jgi:DNA replication protein DnaC
MSTGPSDKTILRIVDRPSKNDGHDLREKANATTKDSICQLCFGTGTWMHPDKGPILCDCRRSNTRDQLSKASRIPLLFRKCSFGSYHAASPSQKWAFDYAERLVKEYPDVGRGLLFMGSVGVGKTHLAVAILSDLIEKKGVACLFYESGSLLKAIQDSYNPVSETSEMRVLAPVYQADVLVLDELGATVPTSWVRDTLYQIINTRYMNRKLTIFTTNSFDEVPEATREVPENSGAQQNSRSFSSKRIQKLTPLEERIGTPLRSRLYEMCSTVEIKGEDYRKRFSKGLSPGPH